MKYSELVEVYEQLEKTPAKLKKVDIIAGLLKKASREGLYKVALLLQGRVFPSFDEREIGLASQSMEKIVAQASGFSVKDVSQRFKKLGDYGLVAEEMMDKKKQRTLMERPLTLEKVFENLQKLAGVGGKGSQDRKFRLVAELVSSAKPKEAKYIVRTAIGDLRIGVAEGIIRDSVAKAFLNTETMEQKKQAASVVEWAWFLRPDYGEIAQIAKDRGAEGLKKVNVELGTPYHVLLAEKSPGLKEALESFDRPALEYKYDGARCVSGNTPIYVKGKGLLSIMDVNIGDYVLTHNGKYRKVIAKNRRIIDKRERVFEFQTFLGNKFRITEKHPILVFVDGKKKWLPIENIPEGAEIVFPVPKIFPSKSIDKKITLSATGGYKKTFKLNKNFFRFLGFWVGDGYTNTYKRTYRIGLMFNKRTELNLLKFYKNIVVKDFNIKNVSESDIRGARCLYWTDMPFLFWLSKKFRNQHVNGWKGKSIPEWFWNIPKEYFMEFLKGWVESDGSVDSIGRTSIITKESWLASFAQLIGLKFGKIMGVRRLCVNGGIYYKIIIPKNNKHSRIKGNNVFVKILRKKELKRTGGDREIDPRARVFNIQVEGDESYCAGFATIHNCAIHKKGDKLWFFTRRLENVTKQFPELRDFVKRAVSDSAKECIIEGEMLGFDKKTGKPMPFQFLSQRIKRKYDIDRMAKEIPIQVNLFDITYLNGKDMFDKPLHERWETLKKIIRPIKGKFQLAEHLETKDLAKAQEFYKESLNASQEGLIVKNMDAKYHPGRRVSGGWLKVKPIMETLDLAIIGAVWGTGKRAGWLGSYILGCRDGDEFKNCGMMGSGLKEKEESVEASGGVTLDTLTNMLKPSITGEKGNEVTIKPTVIVEVAYEEIQKSPNYASGYALRFPRILKIRPDKQVSEADTKARIEKLYHQQKGRIRG